MRAREELGVHTTFKEHKWSVPATSRVCMCLACVTHSYEQTVEKYKWLVWCVLWVGFRWSGEERA